MQYDLEMGWAKLAYQAAETSLQRTLAFNAVLALVAFRTNTPHERRPGRKGDGWTC